MMNLFKKSAVLFLPICLLFSSCATILKGSKQKVTINTKPNGAKVIILNEKGEEVFNGISPAAVKLKTGKPYFRPLRYTVKLTLDGFAEKTLELRCRIDGLYFGNLLLGGALGMIVVDPLTGAMWRFKKSIIYETLEATSTYTEPTFKIVDINDISEEMKKELVSLD